MGIDFEGIKPASDAGKQLYLHYSVQHHCRVQGGCKRLG
jgi:hypothetical protein